MTSFAASDRMAPADAPRSRAERLLNAIERSHLRACTVLLLLSLACFLPGFASLQPMDRDEPRYAQASKQMLESGDFVDIRFQDEARHKKPVGIYWMQSAAVAAAEALGLSDARTTIALYRIPSLIGALASVLLTYWAALAFLGRRGAFLSAAFMGTSVILMVEARLGKTDAMLTLCSVAVMGALARAYFGRGANLLPIGTRLAFWIALAIGILVKGPMVLMFAGSTAAVLSYRERSARWLLALRPKEGVPLALAIVLPWFVAIAWRTGTEFFASSVGQDMLAKVGSGQERHWGPPGFYLIAFFATFWPAAILAAIAVPFAWLNRKDDRVAFALAWIVPSWIVFEAVPTKLPHYVMPLYPAVAILTVMAMASGFVGPHRPAARPSAFLIPFIPIGLMAGLIAAASVFDRTLPWLALPFLVLTSALAFYAWRRFVAGDVSTAALAAVIASPILALGVFGFAQNDLQSLKISPRLAEAARTLSCDTPEIATLGYREPSLVFLVGTKLEMVETGPEAARFLKGGPCRMVFVEQRFEEAFGAEAARLGLDPVLSTRVAGFNINSGRRLDIGAYRTGL
jgi:4-amino-4-deoxy-L-arabinose transferase-like glycosyltransferase